MSRSVPPISTRLASVLLLLRGAWFLFSILMVLLLGGAGTGTTVGILIVLAGLYGAAGIATYKRRRIGGWLAIAVTVFVLVLSAVNRNPSPGLLVDVTILVAILLGWRHLLAAGDS